MGAWVMRGARLQSSWLSRMWRPGAHWWLAVLAIAVAIFGLSSIPAASLFTPGPPEGLLNAVFKKAAHMAFYGALAVALQRALELRPGSWRWALLVAALYGVSDEWHQSYVPGREATLRDVVFDVLGAGLGLWLYARLVASGPNERGAHGQGQEAAVTGDER